MGEKDISQKTLLSHNEVFADVVNVLLFAGEQVVAAEDLTDAQTFSQYKAADSSLHSQERDVAKNWKCGTICVSMFGLENQTKKDAFMPVRVLSYDGASYRAQLTEKSAEIFPVVTLVLYFGVESEWKKPKSLKESLKIDSRLESFVSDYKINVFNLAWLTDEQINAFRSDFRIVAEYLRAMRTGDTGKWTRQKIRYVGEIIDLMRLLSDDEIFDSMETYILDTQREKGGVSVNEFVQNMISKGRNEGIMLGRNEGIMLGRNEGRSEGMAMGENNVLTLFAKLYRAGRSADVQKATEDRSYLRTLMAEFAN